MLEAKLEERKELNKKEIMQIPRFLLDIIKARAELEANLPKQMKGTSTVLKIGPAQDYTQLNLLMKLKSRTILSRFTETHLP